ncbi:sugar kinase [Agaribacterium sp. ZY112]|uniref:sugar kinase n=1 Tax=Agaribacterium sp. ZY112 TaxID=3233574 RepID=UPI00352596B3
MPNLVIFGETMVELSKATDELYKKGFAGDVHSVALYLKRAALAEDVKAYLMCACGQDLSGDQLIDTLHEQNIQSDLTLRHPDRTIGLYMVNTDANGERSFDYWRSTSAAKETLELLEQQGNNKLLDLKPDVFFFSGITLAILSDESRSKLWPLLEQLREQGCDILFDPNYRARLWNNDLDKARGEFEKAFKLSTTLLPSLEDVEMLYGITKFEASAKKLLELNPTATLLIKDGPNGMLYRDESEQFHLTVTPVEKVVDTTAAGDSFNGSFLAARAMGKDVRESLTFAAAIAAEVIQHRGAVIPLEPYTQARDAAL